MQGAKLGHYEIVGTVGRGGMGEVYAARDTKLGRQVALKLLPPEFAGDAERRSRFEREARAAAAVTHPNIATIYEVGESEDRVFIAMEYVRGESLRQRLAPGLPLDEALRIAAEIARGLAKAHGAAVIHRDLKPDNVMIDEEGHARVLDFGLAKVHGAEDTARQAPSEQAETASAVLTQEGRVLGTPGYMSPEQATGKPIDHRSDIFSLGIMIYEMVTGRRPFVGDSFMEVAASTMRDEPPPASQLNPQVPVELDGLIQRCLAKDPQARLQSAAELAVSLEGLGRTMASGLDGRAPQFVVPAAGLVATSVSADPTLGSGSPEADYARFEVAIIELGRRGVELTAANVVAELRLAPAQAEAWLARMQAEGRLQVERDLDTGLPTYQVPGLTVQGPAGLLKPLRRQAQRLLKLDPAIPPSIPQAQQKSVIVGAVAGGFLPGIGLVYAAPFWTMALVTVLGAIGMGLVGTVPVVGEVLASAATILFALLSAALGGAHAWHYNRHGKRVKLRAVDYTQRLPPAGATPPPPTAGPWSG